MSKPRPKIALVHFNKQRAKDGLPWTVHYAGQCIAAAKVTFEVPVESVFKPEKKTNPRAWFKARGYVYIVSPGKHVFIRAEPAHIIVPGWDPNYEIDDDKRREEEEE